MTKGADNSKSHKESVVQFVEDNVKNYSTPRSVTLSNFQVDWEEFSGSFMLKLDEELIEERITFDVQLNGKTEYCLPMFHSPLGAPCSYGAINVTDETDAAILKALHASIPFIQPCGYNKATQSIIDLLTPIHERILDKNQLQEAMAKVSDENYSVTVEV